MKMSFRNHSLCLGAGALTLLCALPAVAQVNVDLGANANGNAGQRVGQGLQRATQGAANAANRVEQGARNLGRGVQDATQGAARRTQQGVQNLRDGVSPQERLNANGQLRGNVRSGDRFQNGNQQSYGGQAQVGANGHVQANTPQIPAQIQGNAQLNAEADRDASWRKTQHNGEWWYYSPKGNWMYYRDNQWNSYSEQNYQRPDGRGGYMAGFRGDNSQSNNDTWMRDGQRVHRIQADGQGRQFIRYNGQQIWIGSDAKASANAGQGNQSSRLKLDADAAVDTAR